MAIHRTLNNPKVTQMIPCSCEECQVSEPFLFDYNRLKRFLAKGETTIPCDHSVTKVPIEALLEGVFSQEEIVEVNRDEIISDARNVFINTYNISGDNYQMDKAPTNVP